MIIKMAEGNLRTKYGEFHEILYYDGQKESIAMVMGNVGNQEEVLCRIHSSCIFGHYFNSLECDCREQMEISQQLIQKQGKGIIILLDQEGKGNGHFALLKSVEHKRKGVKQGEAYEAVGFKRDARDFTSAGKILKDLQVLSVRLLTNNPDKTKMLAPFGIAVTGIEPTVVKPG